MLTSTVALVLLFCVTFASAVLSPVIGPWTPKHTVDVGVTWANESAGLVQVTIGGTAAPIVVEVEGQVLFVITPPDLPAWAVPPHGGGGACIDTGAGMAHVWFDPTGELLGMLTNASGYMPLQVGMALRWRAFSFRFVPQLRSFPPTGLLQPMALPFLVSHANDGQVTLSLQGTQWPPPAPAQTLEFDTLLPDDARPKRSVTAHVPVNTPAWNALCQLNIEPCGNVVLKCAGCMLSIIQLPSMDRAITYLGRTHA